MPEDHLEAYRRIADAIDALREELDAIQERLRVETARTRRQLSMSRLHRTQNQATADDASGRLTPGHESRKTPRG